jgi:hypothetical protein
MKTMRAKLINCQQANAWLNQAFVELKPWLLSGHAYDISIKPETRSLASNRAMWAALADISRQVVWHGQKLSPEDWKNVLSASLQKQRVVPGIDGGWVVMGQSTSQMTKAEMSDLIELAHAFGAERGVRFSAPELEEHA